jgi:hypothetical protein
VKTGIVAGIVFLLFAVLFTFMLVKGGFYQDGYLACITLIIFSFGGSLACAYSVKRSWDDRRNNQGG